MPTRSNGVTGGVWATCPGTCPRSRARAWPPGRASIGAWAATMNGSGWLTTTLITALRLHQAGYQVVYEPDAALYHAEGSTRGLVEDPEDAPLVQRAVEAALIL
jgi:hypothetical protein